MGLSKLFIIGLLITSGLAQAAENEVFFSRKQKFDTDGTELYSSNHDLRAHKKIGIGTSVGGLSGMLGLNGELNLDPENALVLGLGTGPSYGNFNILWKNSMESHYLAPYTKLGYSKWFSSSGGGTAADSSVLRRIFTDRELRSGKFAADFLVGAIGAEYSQLEGEMAGVNFYGELVMMAEIRTAKLIPTGAVGITYFY